MNRGGLGGIPPDGHLKAQETWEESEKEIGTRTLRRRIPSFDK